MIGFRPGEKITLRERMGTCLDPQCNIHRCYECGAREEYRVYVIITGPPDPDKRQRFDYDLGYLCESCVNTLRL